MNNLNTEEIKIAAAIKEKEYLSGNQSDQDYGYNFEDAFTEGVRFAESQIQKKTVRFLVFGCDEYSEPGSDGKLLARAITLENACKFMLKMEQESEVYDMTIYDILENKWFVPDNYGAYYWIDSESKAV